jgi:D-proline reductase (dithiol) PrdB
MRGVPHFLKRSVVARLRHAPVSARPIWYTPPAMPTDSFKWLPRSIAAYYQALPAPDLGPIPWTPLPGPLPRCRIALLTTAGLYLKGEQPSFDLDRERREPFWGDPTYRVLPVDVRQEQIGAAHLHINTEDPERDLNVVLPIDRARELVEAGELGSLAPHHYSFMGYQQDTTEWQQRYGPEVAQRMIEEQVDVALLTPA